MTAMTEPAPSVRRVIDSLVDGQGKVRHLIGVDDAHLLDGYSAHVIHHLAQTREARLVVTVRTGSAQPDAVTALWKDGLLARLDLDVRRHVWCCSKPLGLVDSRPLGRLLRRRSLGQT